MIFLDNCTRKSIKPRKKQIVRFQLNEKKTKESQTRLISWYWKRKPAWRKDLITCNNHPWIIFSFNWSVIIWRERVRGGGFVWNWASKVKGVEEFLGVDGQGGGGSWKLDNFHGRHMCIIPNIFLLNGFTRARSQYRYSRYLRDVIAWKLHHSG